MKIVCGCLAVLGLGVIASGSGEKAEQVARGAWGGMHVSLTVSEKDARLELDCAHGTIEGAIKLDKEGRFDVKGRYVRERPGPVRMDEVERSQPARYTGSLDGQEMTLKIVLEGEQTLGPFLLTQGGRPRVMKCR